MLGKEVVIDGPEYETEAVHNLQRLFNLKMGFGSRKYDAISYRTIGPVTEQEYHSRAELYDKQLNDKVGYVTQGKTIQEKIKVLREFRESQYELLCEVVYKRRGWDKNGVPTPQTIQKLRINFPEVLQVWKYYQNNR